MINCRRGESTAIWLGYAVPVCDPGERKRAMIGRRACGKGSRGRKVWEGKAMTGKDK